MLASKLRPFTFDGVPTAGEAERGVPSPTAGVPGVPGLNYHGMEGEVSGKKREDEGVTSAKARARGEKIKNKMGHGRTMQGKQLSTNCSHLPLRGFKEKQHRP